MKVQLTGLLWVALNGISSSKLEEIKQAYTYQHPLEDTFFVTYVVHNGRIGIPYGNKEKVKRLLGDDIEIIDKRIATHVNKPFDFTLTLRDYQEDVVSDIFRGIDKGLTEFNLSGKPSSGKTITLAAILAKLGVKTLIIANQSMLVEQIYQEMQDNTTADVKMLTSKDFELSDINIATSQFISQNADVWYALKKGVGCIVVDEAHSLASETTTRIVQRIYAKYSIFISATFTRSVDKRTQALTDFAGTSQYILENKNLIVPNIMMVQCPERYPRFTSKHRYVKDKIHFFSQWSIYEKIITITKGSLKKNRQVFIVTDIVEMQDKLKEVLSEYGVGVLNGSTKKVDREQILKDYDNGTLKVIVGGMVLNAGLSIPKISTIIRVSFPKSGEKNVQIVGRALRDFKGKDGAYMFDLVFVGQNTIDRVNRYKENGYKVSQHSWEKLKEKL
jgi:superfamily II DNA or RNA helicase